MLKPFWELLLELFTFELVMLLLLMTLSLVSIAAIDQLNWPTRWSLQVA